MIAGGGMLIALALNLTLLPALLMILRPPAAHFAEPPLQVSRIDDFVLGHRRRVLTGFVVAGIACAALLPLLQFDFNPIHLRDPKTQSVSTLYDLMNDANSTPDTLEVVRPNLAAAQALAAQVQRVPEVDSARTLADFVPADQAPKLATIADAASLLDIALNPIVTSPAPSDGEVVRSLVATAASLRQGANCHEAASAQALRLATALDRLANAPQALRAKAATMLMTPFATVLTQIQNVLAAQPVTLQSLPPELVRDWIAADGRARVSISPKGNANDDAVLSRFIDATTKVAPDATGTPIGIREGGRTVVRAFLEAGALSFVAITALLFLVLRRVRDVAITMAPIVLTGLLTLGSCVVIGQPLNFANIIALPLLFGIGVAFHIYFVMSWRSGGSHLLTSSTARSGALLGADDGDWLRQPMGIESSGYGEHGQATDDLTALDPGLGADLPASADGGAAGEKAGGRARAPAQRCSATKLRCRPPRRRVRFVAAHKRFAWRPGFQPLTERR